MEPQARKPDPTLAFFGKFCNSRRIMAYAQVCAMDIPADLRDKLTQYRNLLMVLAGAPMLMLVHARLWTLVVTVLLWVGLWPVKMRMERGLDADITPYVKGKS